MARRMTLEGAEVKAVCELMPYSGGLARNIEQCLNDFNIPLRLSHTVVDIRGRERLEGVVIAKRNGGIRETFTVRRVSYGIGVERTSPLHSPRVDHIEVIRRGKVRRAKLYYLRNLQGKAAKIKEAKRV